MGDRGHTIDMGRKEEGLLCHFRGELGPRLIQCGLGRAAEVYFRTKWRLHPSSRLATIEMGRKLERGAPSPFGEGGWVPI